MKPDPHHSSSTRMLDAAIDAGILASSQAQTPTVGRGWIASQASLETTELPSMSALTTATLIA